MVFVPLASSFLEIAVSIPNNITVIQQRIDDAAKRAGRPASEVLLMAVTKTHPAEHIREAYNAGLRLFGENRVQEFSGKAAALVDLTGAAWHMIGHLQTNKAAKAAEIFSAVDSVDSVKLAEKLNCGRARSGQAAQRTDRSQCRRRGGEKRCFSRLRRTRAVAAICIRL